MVYIYTIENNKKFLEILVKIEVLEKSEKVNGANSGITVRPTADRIN